MPLNTLGSLNNLGREKLGSKVDLWWRLEAAAVQQFKDDLVGGKFLPSYGPTAPEAVTVPADVSPAGAALVVPDGAFLPLLELWVELGLSRQQLLDPDLTTAQSLLMRAANLLAQGEDLVIILGAPALVLPQFAGGLGQVGTVGVRPAPVAPGLLYAANAATAQRVDAIAPDQYGFNTFTAVVKARAQLIARGHFGPLALVLPPIVYADVCRLDPVVQEAPLERIEPLAARGVHATNALPNVLPPPPPPAPAGVVPFVPQRYGLLLSLGGNPLDLVVGVNPNPTTTITQENPAGLTQVRMLTRFTARVKDARAIVRLDFQ